MNWDSWRSHGWIFAYCYWTCLYFSLFLWIVILLSGICKLKHKNLKKLFKNLGFSSPDREKSTVSAYALCVVRGSGRHGLVLTVYRSCCGAVYCNRSCLFVGLYVCRSVTTITQNCVHRSSPNLVCRWRYIYIDHLHSSWLNFGVPRPRERNLRRVEIFWLRLTTTATAQCLRLLWALFCVIKQPEAQFQTQSFKCSVLYVRCGDWWC